MLSANSISADTSSTEGNRSEVQESVFGRENDTVWHRYNLKNFHSIDNSVNAEIHYTQGDRYEVTVSADAGAVKTINVKVVNGTLVIEKSAKTYGQGNSYDTTNFIFHIAAPKLDAIGNTSTMTFTADGIKADKFEVTNSGMLQLNPGTVVCAFATINNKGMLDADGHIRATTATVENAGSCDLGTSFGVDGDFTSVNNGQMTMEGKVCAGLVKMNNSGFTTYALGIEADKLDISMSGVDTGNMSYKGGDMDIHCLGNMTLELDTDCGKITSHTDGRLIMNVSGKNKGCYNYGAVTKVSHRFDGPTGEE